MNDACVMRARDACVDDDAWMTTVRARRRCAARARRSMRGAWTVTACAVAACAVATHATRATGPDESWALIVDASRYWFNYRHGANALSVYRAVRRMGTADSRVVLMLADDHACDARNARHGRVRVGGGTELVGDEVEVDYRGSEVTPENVARVLTNRHAPGTPRSKKLLPGPRSNVLIYITGHGGDGFIKFQDQSQLRDGEIADALAQMYAKGRYNEVLFLVDTCQAATLAQAIRSPRVLALSSSDAGENSYSLFADPEIGVHVIDRFTYHVLDFFERLKSESVETMGELHAALTRHKLMSTAVLDVKTFTHRDAKAVKLSEFFGGAMRTRALSGAFDWFVGAKSTTMSAPTAMTMSPPAFERVRIEDLGFIVP